MSHAISSYYDRDLIESAVGTGQHREVIGGLWETLGPIQLELMRKHGLEASHRFLDIGCGSLRGGTHFVRFLETDHYYGLDLNQALLDAGYEVELAAQDLQNKLPRANLRTSDAFDFSQFGVKFDRAIAFSVFTHLPLDQIRICLEKLSVVMSPGGIFFATFFEAPEHSPTHHDILQGSGEITTHAGSDPYHQRVSDFHHLVASLPWDVFCIDDFGHPRGQKLVGFKRRPDSRPTDEALAELPLKDADALAPGESHYRAYVGPPDRYDLLSASQFALLFQLGLRDHNKVLDFGCGSLRLGRLLIPFLRESGYYGIDPNGWLIEEGINHELGRSAVTIKKPRFSYNDDFDCGVFGERFDFIIAQSIVTHTGPDQLHALLSTVGGAIAEGGIFVFSYISDPDATDLPADGWHYPGCVGYAPSALEQILKQYGLSSIELPWHHPAARWCAAALRQEDLPGSDVMADLGGRVVR